MVRCLMIPYLIDRNFCIYYRLHRCPPVDIDGIRGPVLVLYLQAISGAIIPAPMAIGLHLQFWEAASVDEWLYNGGHIKIIVHRTSYLNSLLYRSQRVGTEFSVTRYASWIAVPSAPVAACYCCFSRLPSVWSREVSMVCLQEYPGTQLYELYSRPGTTSYASISHVRLWLVYSSISASHGFLGNLQFDQETTEMNLLMRVTDLVREETYNGRSVVILAINLPICQFNNSRSLHFFLAAWPVVELVPLLQVLVLWLFNLNRFNFQPICSRQPRSRYQYLGWKHQPLQSWYAVMQT
uniref:Photosystem II protein D1 n=1 Tax=Oryza coarctata TaxID=77588 RepID=A0A2I8BIJ1_ORYCO|nr:photosystem II protein D1 [Oryza coarctata]AUT20038.1 photosystem II protein D1 [Oryza coarctata]